MVMQAKPLSTDELDTPEYARFKPLEYDPSRLYYWRRDILIPEGNRRSLDDETEINHLQTQYDSETNLEKKEILQQELNLYKWRTKQRTKNTNTDTDNNRSMRDIISDYYPAELGMTRPWREIHSHIPDYSKSLNYGYNVYNKKQCYYE
jgi:hypothetical protein